MMKRAMCEHKITQFHPLTQSKFFSLPLKPLSFPATVYGLCAAMQEVGAEGRCLPLES